MLRSMAFGQRHRADTCRGFVHDLKHPGKGRHDRVRYYRTRIIEMNVLPYRTWLTHADVGEVGAGAFRAEQLRCLISKIAGRRWPPEDFVLRQRTDLLGMAVAAAVRDVDVAAFGFERRQRFNSGSRRGLRKNNAGENAHHESEARIDQCRTTGDQHQLVHATSSLASSGTSGTALALVPYVMHQTFQANTKWLRNMSTPPMPRHT